MTAMPVGTERDLRPLFEPRSVAVVGASNDPAKWGQWLARGALRGEHRRSVFLVNRSGAEVLGRRPFSSVEELPEPPELVVLAVPASSFEETVDASLAAGARAIVAIAAGLGETSDEGRQREQAVVERVRARRRGAPRAELPRRLRRGRRARSLLERLRPGADRAGLAERQPGDRALAAGLGGRPRASPGSPRSGTRRTSRPQRSSGSSRRTTGRR